MLQFQKFPLCVSVTIEEKKTNTGAALTYLMLLVALEKVKKNKTTTAQ